MSTLATRGSGRLNLSARDRKKASERKPTPARSAVQCSAVLPLGLSTVCCAYVSAGYLRIAGRTVLCRTHLPRVDVRNQRALQEADGEVRRPRERRQRRFRPMGRQCIQYCYAAGLRSVAQRCAQGGLAVEHPSIRGSPVGRSVQNAATAQFRQSRRRALR